MILAALALTRIGFMAPAAEASVLEYAAAEQGVQLAIAESNAGGARFCLQRVVGEEGPWQGAATRLAKLAYDEHVRAVVGGWDGRSAHMAEQVVARAKGDLLFVTPWASDATLIPIPWFARAVPDDRAQAVALAREIYVRHGWQRVVLLQQDGDYDARRAADAFRALAPLAVTSVPFALETTAHDVLPHLAHAQAIVLFGGAAAAGRMTAALRTAGVRMPFLAPLRLASPDFVRAGGSADLYVRPTGPEADAFARRSLEAPWPVSFFAYRATCALLRAVGDRRALRLPSAPITVGPSPRL